MKSKTFITSVILALAAIVCLAVIFYYRSQKNNEPIIPNQPENFSTNLPATENEISTSTPLFKIEGEISRGNPNKKQIIFTFDGGSGINSGEKILEITAKHDVKATFFATGKFAEKYPNFIKQAAADGHEIFNHTYSHPYLTQISDEQIKEEFTKVDDVIKSLTNKDTRPFFRPPYGDRNAHVLEVAQNEGYQSVFWTLDALDWMPEKTTEQTKDRILSNLKNGSIILMHIGDNITGQILDEVFTEIEEQGYKIVNLSEGLK
ncbi:MAG: polysaccharide deacetylase family protein [Candidatus Portnoybacteria bacterium]|nr:polysaccharide deacetylase family protein [Candidatus Portnoybacteria bacterium]